MASIRERTTKAGQTTWTVLFRHAKRQTSKTFATRKDAERFAGMIELVGLDQAIRLLENPDAPTLTVAELFDQWLTWKSDVQRQVTERTIKDYRRDFDNWIAPRLGTLPAEAVDELIVQQWVDWMGSRGLEPKSIGDRHMILSQMYRWGSSRTRRLVSHNPCLETMLPKKTKKPPKGFSLAQWLAMRAWAMEHEPDAADLIRFLAATGWRWGEATPLRVGSVEDYGDRQLPDGRIVPVVFVSVDVVVRRDEDDRYVEAQGEAKSRAGVRRINLPPDAAEVVRRRSVARGPLDYVFTNAAGKRWHTNNFRTREFARILEGAGIEKVKGMGVHWLRHTSVGVLDRAQVSASKMQRRIGHESITTTLGVYGGTIDNTLSDDELLRMDALLAPPPASSQIVSGAVLRGELAGPDPAPPATPREH